ncbi:PadR family transcriptional regulator [Hamadaea tsunoensis]|uniref:PadR family transcriptional regulator n=1 Tax=Hamadaea tsunoensis TaxID=53368 RepID=UPI0004171B6A|nr:PadR family transcriptional regulator [Hamadaea tsunoensis]
MPRTPDTSPQTLKVFDALLEDPQGWHYGYALSKRTGLASGTLYPILIRLVERELLDTRWAEAEPGRPPRHLYRLTGDGVQVATQRLAVGRKSIPLSGLTPRTVS